MNTLAQRVAAVFRSRVAFERGLLSFGVKDFGQLEGKGRQFAVLTAYRPTSKSTNKEQMTKLLQDIQKLGYRHVIPQKATWADAQTGKVSGERSILVPHMSFEHAVALGKKYNQDGVIYKDPSGTIGIYNNDGTADMAYDTKTGDPSVSKALDKSEYSKARSMSFGLNIVPGKFKWSGGPVKAEHIMKRIQDESAKDGGSEGGEGDTTWWKSQTPAFQQKYLEEHPHSSYKSARA